MVKELKPENIAVVFNFSKHPEQQMNHEESAQFLIKQKEDCADFLNFIKDSLSQEGQAKVPIFIPEQIHCVQAVKFSDQKDKEKAIRPQLVQFIKSKLGVGSLEGQKVNPEIVANNLKDSALRLFLELLKSFFSGLVKNVRGLGGWELDSTSEMDGYDYSI